ncbi:hypothetical protein V520_14490 [Pseudomonas putida KG-4]|nr:hypothetical protein V520_14490 [Pseudomonas putida KG-4]
MPSDHGFPTVTLNTIYAMLDIVRRIGDVVIASEIVSFKVDESIEFSAIANITFIVNYSDLFPV